MVIDSKLFVNELDQIMIFSGIMEFLSLFYSIISVCVHTCMLAWVCVCVDVLDMILSHKSLKYAWEGSAVGSHAVVLEETACAAKVSLGLSMEVLLIIPDPPTQSHCKAL